MSLLEHLNTEQQEAVKTVDGPVLVLAGAGSGKTRALTYRIAYLVREAGVSPGNILSVTFTNKAANEMKERLADLIGDIPGMWIGTFHSACARILRREVDCIPRDRSFTIYDTEDQTAEIKRSLAYLDLSPRQFVPGVVRGRISRAKNEFVGPEEFERLARTAFDEQVAQVYRVYRDALRRNNAFDFDDLLLEPIRLFEDHPDVLDAYRDRFRYVLVDEWQDTNRPQYVFVRMLSERHRNLCVVGDDDQSIYGWRGATIENILDFERGYRDARVIRMERNYRSTKRILTAGNHVIQNNVGRKGKVLWTEREEGEKLVLYEGVDDADEARYIVRTIQEEIGRNDRSPRAFALFYRTNAQSRALEDELRRAGLPYMIVGGVRFYERKEVKDVLAYLRLLANPRDEVTLRRIVNVPPRGIGDASMKKLEDFARDLGIGLFDALGRIEELENLSSAIARRFRSFRHLIEELFVFEREHRFDELAAEVVQRTGYLDMLLEESSQEAEARVENVQELLSAIRAFMERPDDPTLDAFLEEVSLITDIDQWDRGQDAVSLMTLHSAKGLEFPVVFITGLEDGLFPLARSAESQSELEEERRLFYVGITRAQERLFLTHARKRRFGYGNVPSRFLREIPQNLVEFAHSEERPRRWRTGTSGGSRKAETPEPEVQVHPAYEDISQEALSLEVGSWVVHKNWGRGCIVETEGAGERMKLVVEFEGGAQKKLLVKYAGLMPG